METLGEPFPKGSLNFSLVPAWGNSKTACTHRLYGTTEAEF